VLLDATVVTNFEAGRVDKADAATATEAGAQISAQRQQGRRHPTDKALIADQSRKSGTPVATDVFEIVVLERAIPLLMKPNQNRQDLAETKLPRAKARLQRMAQQLQLPLRLKSLAKFIDAVKEFF